MKWRGFAMVVAWMAAAGCGQGLRLTPTATPIRPQPDAPGVYLVAGGGTGTAQNLYAMLLDANQRPLDQSLRHAQRAANGLALTWPFEAHAAAVIAYVDSNGDGRCNEATSRTVLSAALGPQRVFLTDMASASDCELFNQEPVESSGYSIALYSDPAAADAAATLTITVQNQTTGDLLYSGELPGVQGVWSIPAQAQQGQPYLLTANGGNLSIGVSLGAIYSDTVVVLQGGP